MIKAATQGAAGGIIAMFALTLSHPTNAACLRLAQFVPDIPPVVVGTTTLASLSAPDAIVTAFENIVFDTITDYRVLAEDTYNIVAVAPGFGERTRAVRVNGNTDYTIGAVGLFIGTPGAETDLDDLLIIDDNTLAKPGSARLRLIHLSPDTGSIDVAASGTSLIVNMTFEDISGYFELDAGVVDLIVRDTATSSDLTTSTLTLAGGSVTTAFIGGLSVRQQTLSVSTVVDAPNSCSVRNFEGIWFDPNQDGQGVQLVQTGDRLGGVWYVYGSDGQSAWYNFTGDIADNRFSGTLLEFSGPSLAGPFNPANVTSTNGGSVSIEFSASTRSAAFEATVGSTTRRLSLVPFEL